VWCSSAPGIVWHQGEAAAKQLVVVVRVVVLDCSGRTPDRRIEQSSVVAHGGRRLGSCARDGALVTERRQDCWVVFSLALQGSWYERVVPAAPDAKDGGWWPHCERRQARRGRTRRAARGSRLWTVQQGARRASMLSFIGRQEAVRERGNVMRTNGQCPLMAIKVGT
jgi:hypothetical protein